MARARRAARHLGAPQRAALLYRAAAHFTRSAPLAITAALRRISLASPAA